MCKIDQDNQADRNNSDQYFARMRKKTESNTVILNQRKMENTRNNGNRFSKMPQR